MIKSRFIKFLRHLNLKTIKQTVANVSKRRLLGLASEIAYNAILSLFPAILAILTAIGLLEEGLQNIFKDLAEQLSRFNY
mgnify:CR=1 FL=1